VLDEPLGQDDGRVVTVAVEEEQEVGEADLGGNIEDGVCDDLGVDGELVGSLSQGKDDWVSGPKDQGHSAEEDKETLGLSWSLVGGLHSAGEQHPPDGEETNTRDGKEGPPGSLARGVPGRNGSTEETSDDHENVKEDDQHSVRWRETSEDSEGDEEERRGEQPVNVSGVVDLSVVDVVAGLLGSVDRNVCDTESGGHGEVRDHCDGENEGGEPVEEPGTFLNSLGDDEDTDQTDGEDGKHDPEGRVAWVGGMEESDVRGWESTGWEGEVVGVVRTWVTCASGRVDRDGGGGSVVVLVTLELWHKVHDG